MLTAGQLIKASIKLYKENFTLFLRYLGVLAALWIVLIGASALLMGLTSTTTQTGPNSYTFEASMSIMVVIAIALGIATLAISLALIRVMAKRYENQPVPSEISNELHAIKPLIWPAIYTSILAGIFIVLGFFAFLIPGIIFSVWYAFTTLNVAIDGHKGMTALKASRELSRGRWWNVFWKIALPSIVFGFLNLIIQFVILAPIGFFSYVGNEQVGQIMANLLGAFASLLVMPLTTGALVILYCELKKHPASAPVSSSTTVTT